MAKTNDTTTFPITAPAAADLLFGTDVSNTSNSPDGETVNFTVEDVLDYMASGGVGAPKIQTAGIQDDAVTAAKLNLLTASYSGTLPSASSTYISRPSSASFFPAVSGQNNEIEGRMRNNALQVVNLNSDFFRTWSVSWSYVA